MFSKFFYIKSCRLWDNVNKYSRAGEATDYNMALAHLTLRTHTQNMYYLLLFHCNNCCKNAPHWYVMRTLPVFFDSLGHNNLSAVPLKKCCRFVCSLTFPTLQPRPYIRDISSTLFYLLFSHIFSYLPHTWLHFFYVFHFFSRYYYTFCCNLYARNSKSAPFLF